MEIEDIVSDRWPRSAFRLALEDLEPARLSEAGHEAGRNRVRAALREDPLSLTGAAALLRSARDEEREELFERAERLTGGKFGRTVLLYAPCYLSNWCVNHCVYCGFNYNQNIERRHLSGQDLDAELARLRLKGIRRALLVAGEFPSKISMEFIRDAILRARHLFPEVDLEVGPALEGDYRLWAEAGAGGLTCYQETYAADRYAALHPRGPKSRMEFRLGAPERAARAGISRLGIGVLLGLSEPTADLLALIAHARFLQTRWPDVSLTVSLPRLRPGVSGYVPEYLIDSESFQVYLAVLRLALPEVGLVLSTREPAGLRRRLLPFGVTQMSAGSVTVPGGYGSGATEGGQFSVADHRSVQEVVEDLLAQGFHPVWTADGWPAERRRGEVEGSTASGPEAFAREAPRIPPRDLLSLPEIDSPS